MYILRFTITVMRGNQENKLKNNFAYTIVNFQDFFFNFISLGIFCQSKIRISVIICSYDLIHDAQFTASWKKKSKNEKSPAIRQLYKLSDVTFTLLYSLYRWLLWTVTLVGYTSKLEWSEIDLSQKRSECELSIGVLRLI